VSGHDLGGTLDVVIRYVRSPTEPECLDRGRSRRIHFVPLRRTDPLTGAYQQDDRRSRPGPVVSLAAALNMKGRSVGDE
jgi:hypothetical protein